MDSASHSPGHLLAPSHPYQVIRTQLLPDLSALPSGSSSPGREITFRSLKSIDPHLLSDLLSSTLPLDSTLISPDELKPP
ncbi:unnamed protein product [Boreogadus saida]